MNPRIINVRGTMPQNRISRAARVEAIEAECKIAAIQGPQAQCAHSTYANRLTQQQLISVKSAEIVHNKANIYD